MKKWDLNCTVDSQNRMHKFLATEEGKVIADVSNIDLDLLLIIRDAHNEEVKGEE